LIQRSGDKPYQPCVVYCATYLHLKKQGKIMYKSKSVLVGFCLFVFSIGSYAGDVSISSAWSLAVPPSSKNGAVYLLIENKGSEADMLMDATTDVSKSVELHTTSHDHGQMKMHHHHSLEIPGNSSLTMEPGGHHIMLMGLVESLTPGQKFDLTLKFMKGGEIKTEVEVVESPPNN